MTSNTDIVNEFKKFHANIGNEIRNKIPYISSKTIINDDYRRNKNDHSIFLEPTDEEEVHKEEVHGVVSQFSLRRSMDYHDINMYCIKYIIGSIIKPLIHICYLSFLTGIFSDDMKIARVIHIFI